MRIEGFLRHASRIHSDAMRERQQTGSYSEATARRVALVQKGFALVLGHLHRVNELEQDSHTFDHAAWRVMWKETARGLQAINLPE